MYCLKNKTDVNKHRGNVCNYQGASSGLHACNYHQIIVNVESLEYLFYDIMQHTLYAYHPISVVLGNCQPSYCGAAIMYKVYPTSNYVIDIVYSYARISNLVIISNDL